MKLTKKFANIEEYNEYISLNNNVEIAYIEDEDKVYINGVCYTKEYDVPIIKVNDCTKLYGGASMYAGGKYHPDNMKNYPRLDLTLVIPQGKTFEKYRNDVNGDILYTCITNIELPNGYPDIYECEFDHLLSLKSINIPNSVTSIGHAAFRYCVNLRNIVIPDSVQYLGENAFHHCINLTSVKLSNNIKEILYYCFRNCKSLENINLPDNIETICESSFAMCYNLKTIEYNGNKEITVYRNAFQGCISLERLPEKLLNNIVYIGDNVFHGCHNLDVEHTLSNLNKDCEISQYVFGARFHTQEGIDEFISLCEKYGNKYKITTYE